MKLYKSGAIMSTNIHYFEKLFSYGTLQQETVQLATFGRTLQGTPDILIDYHLSNLEIKDPVVIATSGKTIHPVLMYTGKKTDEITGTVFDITADELQSADRYEVADYKRVSATLRSGKIAWVYVSVSSPQKTKIS